MFYSGGSLEESPAPKGLPGVSEGLMVKGLKSRPGLAMSQVFCIRHRECVFQHIDISSK